MYRSKGNEKLSTGCSPTLDSSCLYVLETWKSVMSSMRQIVGACWLHEIRLPVGTWRYPPKSLHVYVHLLPDPPRMNTVLPPHVQQSPSYS